MLKGFQHIRGIVSVVLCVFTVIMVGVMSCNDDQSSTLSAPPIPMFPSSWEPNERDSVLPSSFTARRGSSCQFSAVAGKESFDVTAPAGDFRITYTTWLGTFYVAARATECASMTIGLQPCDEVKAVSIQKGSIAGIGCGTWPSGPVTLYSWPCGGATECSQVFTADPASAPVTLLSGGGSLTNPIPACNQPLLPCSGNSCGQNTPTPLFCPGNKEGQTGITTPRTDTFSVEMGRSSGTFRFYHQTYRVPDRMIVAYEGKTLFDSGCNGSYGTEYLSYAGSSHTIIVTVSSMCSYYESTDWDFEIGCPQ